MPHIITSRTAIGCFANKFSAKSSRLANDLKANGLKLSVVQHLNAYCGYTLVVIVACAIEKISTAKRQQFLHTHINGQPLSLLLCMAGAYRQHVQSPGGT